MVLWISATGVSVQVHVCPDSYDKCSDNHLNFSSSKIKELVKDYNLSNNSNKGACETSRSQEREEQTNRKPKNIMHLAIAITST